MSSSLSAPNIIISDLYGHGENTRISKPLLNNKWTYSNDRIRE